MKHLIFVSIFLLIIKADEISAQPYNWNPEKKLTEGYYDSDPKFIQLINQNYWNHNLDLLIFKRKNSLTDTLSGICAVKIDTGGINGVPFYLSNGTFSDINPDVCIGNCCIEIRNALAVWESKRQEGSIIAGCYFDYNLGWGKTFIIDSSSDNHNPKATGITNTTYSVVYQSGNDIIYKEIDAVNSSTIYSFNLTSGDTSVCSKPEIGRKPGILNNTQITYQQKKSDGDFSVLRRIYTSNNIWSEPEILSDLGDNRTSVYLLGETEYNPGIESNRSGNWNSYWFRENGLEGLSNFNYDADNTSLRTFLNNRVTSSFIYSNTYAYKEELLNQKRIILFNKDFSNDKDTVPINSIENTGLTINAGLKYFNYDFLIWVVYNKDNDGLSSLYGKSVRVKNTGIIENNSFSPDKFMIYQNYPNPFNPSTNLEFGIPELGFVSLKVYDALGKVVKTLVNENKPAGYYNVEFDGNDLPSGIYFYRLEAGEFTLTKRMILLK